MGTHFLLLIPFAGLLSSLYGVLLVRGKIRSTPPHLDHPFALYPVSILKPVKGVDSGLEKNLQSFFRLDYPDYELIFSVAHAQDAAMPVILKLMALNPRVPARLVVGAAELGPNPKVNNLAKAFGAAKHELLLISDSNVRVKPDYLRRLVAHLEPGVGMVSASVIGVGAENAAGVLEATYLNTFYLRWMHFAERMGQTCVVGKSMLFSKKTLLRFGGLPVLARYLAEDYMAGMAVERLGLRVVLACDPVEQYVGRYSFADFWKRHVRWGRLRKAQAPVAFFFEPFFSPLLVSAASAFWVGRWSWVLFTTWLFVHALQLAFLKDRFAGKRIVVSLAAALACELLSPVLWMWIASGNTVHWRGKDFKIVKGGFLEGV